MSNLLFNACHLAGACPNLGLEFMGEVFLNEAHWEAQSKAEVERHGYPSTVSSTPAEDWEKAATLGLDPEQVESAMDFLLADSSIQEYGQPDNPNPGFKTLLQLRNEASLAFRDPAEQVSYNVVLRAIERICQEGKVFIGIAPGRFEGYNWSLEYDISFPSCPHVPVLSNGSTPECKRQDLKLLLGTETFEYTDYSDFQFRVFDSIGVECSKLGKSWHINPEEPFVAYSVDDMFFWTDSYISRKKDVGLIIANEAFAQLFREDYARANGMLEAALLDGYVIKNREDEGITTLDEYKENHIDPIDFYQIYMREDWTESMFEAAQGNLVLLVKDLAEALAPKLMRSMNGKESSFTLHYAHMDEGRLDFKASVQTADAFHYLTFENNRFRVRTEKRKTAS